MKTGNLVRNHRAKTWGEGSVSEAIDMIKLVEDLPKRPRGRACAVLTHEYYGQKAWATELSQRTGAKHVDLLDLFADNEQLASNVSSFSVDELFNLLQKQVESPALIVTGIEFLKAAWSGNANAFEQFAHRMETREQLPAIIFVMQFDSELAKRRFKRFRQYKFVIDQKETLALI